MLDEFPDLERERGGLLASGSGGRGTEGEETHSHRFAHETELLLHGLEGRNLGRRAICAEEVPGIEAGEVLEGSEELVTAHCRRDEL